MKKFLSIFLTFIVCFSMLTVNVFAYSDYINDDISENFNNFELTTDYSKTFTIPGYDKLKNDIGVKFDQFGNGYSLTSYTCSLYYIYSNDLNVINVQTGEQETITTNKYFYVLTFGHQQNQFMLWRNTENDIDDNRKFNNISIINNISGSPVVISEDGVNWYYIDDSLNTDNTVTLNVCKSVSFYSKVYADLTDDYFMFLVSPEVSKQVDFGDSVLDSYEYFQYYNYFNRTLYQFGVDNKTPNINTGDYSVYVNPYNDNYINNSDVYCFEYPSEDKTFTINVPYDIGYLNNEKSSQEIISNSAHVWWTSLGNNYSLDYETIHDASYLESITFSFYTSIWQSNYKLHLGVLNEDTETIEHLKTFDLYNGYDLKPNTFYQVDFNIKDKISLGEDVVYYLGVSWYNNLTKEDVYIDYPILVRCLNGFNKSGLITSDSNDIYIQGVTGYPSNPDDYITGDLDSVTKPSIDIGDSVVEDYVKNFDTGFKWLDNLLNSIYQFLKTLTDTIASVFSILTETVTLLIDSINDLFEMVSSVFSIFPHEIQVIFKGILAVFAFYVIARLLLKIIG